MAQYRLPDGRILNVDEDITQENAIILQNKLSELYPDYYQPYKEEVRQTFAGHTEELVKGIPRGLLGTFISAGEGVANLFSTGNDSAASKYFQDLQEELNESSLGVDEGYEEAFSSKLGSGLGSFASFFIPGTVAGKLAGVTGKGLSAKEKFKRAAKFQLSGAASLGVPVGISEQGFNLQASRDLGETISAGQEIASEILGGAIGATEIFSLQRLFRFIPKGYKERLSIPEKLREAVKTGTAEAFQESLAGIAQDAVSLGIYSDELPMADSLFDDFTVGGSVGFISDLALRGVLGKRSIGNEYIKEQEAESRKLVEEQKFQARKDFRLAELADQPLGLPLIDTAPESTLQFKDVPNMEEFEIITNPNGTSSIIGIETSTDYGVFDSVEDAAKQATVLRKELRNDFIDTAVKHNLSINGLYGNGTAYVLGRKLYDPDSNLIPAPVIAALDSSISFKRKQKAEKLIEAETQLDRAVINDLMGDAPLEEGYIEKLQEQINKSKTSYPVQPKDIDASSLVGQLYTKVKKKNIPVKYFYTPQEAKQILSPADFNALMSEKASVKFRTRPRRRSEDTGNETRIIDSSKENLDKVFEQKNIEVDYNSPAFQYLAETITGAKKLGAMNKGQKELLVTEILKLPRFNVKTPLPDYTPRVYSVNDLNNLYTDYKGQRISNAEIKAFVKKANDGSDLTAKELNQLKDDLLNSGRARKEKNRLIMNDDFEIEQGKKAQSLNETPEEFTSRLSETTPLSQDEIAEIVERNAYEESEQVNEQKILEEQAFDSPQKYINLENFARQRLDELGLSDIGLKLQDRLKSSNRINKVDGTYVFEEAPADATAEFDAPMRNILLAMEKIDPDGSKTDAQLEEDISGLIDHEAIHALRELDLLTQAEYKNLLAFAKNKLKSVKVEVDGQTISEAERINRAYAQDPQTVIDEEYVAQLFRIYRENPNTIKGKPQKTIRKIIDFFKGFFDAIFGTGFSSPIGVIEDISAGVVGKRERDVIRSSRDAEAIFGVDGQAIFPTFNKEADEINRRISEAEAEVYNANNILQQEGSFVTNATYKKMSDNLARAQQRLDQLKSLKKLTPRFMRTGIAPRDMLFPGEIENSLYTTYQQTNGNPTAKDFKAVLKSFAPRSKKDHNLVDYASLKTDFKEAMESGIDYLWYEKWGTNIPNLVGSVNMNEFSGVFGVTSGQATPEKNLQDTLRTMIIARQINPESNPKEFVNELQKFGIGKNNPQRQEDILDIYKTGIFKRTGTGQKTATYALEIMEAANNSFTPFSVIDRHMLRKFGIDEAKATPQEYRLVQGIIALLSTETYNINGEPRIFNNPRQIQAALWGHQRYDGPTKITNEGSYEASVKKSQKEIQEISSMIQDGSFSLESSFSDKFIHAPRYRSNTKSNVFDTNLSRNMTEAMLNKVPSTIIEFKMGTERGYLPRSLEKSLPFSTFNNYQDQVLKKLTVGGKLKFLTNLGIPHDITRSAGTWDTYLNPNIIVKYPGVDPKTIRAVTQVMTDALMQDAAIISRPVSAGKLSTGLLVEKVDTTNFSVDELQELNDDFSSIQRAGEPVSFTLVPSSRTGLTLIDPLSFVKEDYSNEDITNFLNTVVPVLRGRGYTVKRYANESEYIEYGEQKDYTAGTRQAIRGLRDRGSVLESSDLQRTIIRDLYLPAYESYRQFAKEVGFEPNSVPPYLQEDSALAGEADIIDYDIAEIQREAQVRAESMSVGNIPRYNVNANPVALKIAFDLEADPNINIPPIPSRFNRDAAPVPPEFQETVNKLGGVNQPSESFAESVVKVSEYPDLIGRMLAKARVNYIDKLSDAEKGVLKSAERSAIVDELQNLADTSGIKALRLSERSRGILAEMLMRGIPVFSNLDNINLSPQLRAYIEQQDDISYGVTSVEDFEHGGLIQIFSPLYENPNVNLEQLFKVYAIAQRGTRLNAEGKETPVDDDVIAQAEKIKNDYPVVKQVYDQFQEFNNKVIDYAVDAGILSLTRTNGQLIQDIVANSDLKTSELQELEYDQLIVLAKELNLNLDADNQIETRGTAQIWKDNSDYYPFYRHMSDESIGGPKIASGFIAGNPLNIQLKGSEAAIEPAPLEAITNNLLAIVTASMKNDGLRKMMREHETSGLAIRLDKPESGADVITVFLNGQKVDYKVADPLMINGLEAIGMNDTGELMKYLAMPASFLREMVTRDPGFMLVNVFRDTLSSYVTSGANYKPFIDQIKAINSDLSDLKRFGIIGGYDFSNDPMDIENYIKKELGKMGVGENGSYNASTAFTKLWDYLGQATTRSDALTRKAVADKVFELTGSQAEAAYQALEVINFGRRGASPVFRIITAAIPFLNARLQGLDVLYRAHTGRYSAVRVGGETREDVALNTALATLGRGGLLALLTGLYYMLVSDDEEYTNANRNVRDDNWIIPLAEGMPALKLPIPFEIGVLYKVIPERVIDTALGGDINETYKTLQRQAITTLKVDPLGFQVVKPIMEVINNRSSYTGQAIVPYYMEKGLEAGLQSRYSTNELARVIGESLNISPIKIEYILSGYGGTIGGYILGLADATTRAVTDRDYITPRIDKAPFLKRFLQTELGGGLQQQFYELREESDRYQQTVNALKREGRYDELQTYMKNKSGLSRTRPQLLALERYMTHWRKQRDRVLNSKLITPEQKKDIIEDMEVQRDIRLAYVPQLREQSDIPFMSLGI